MLAFVSKTKDYITLCQIWLKFYRIFLNSLYDSSLNKISLIFGPREHFLVLKTSCKYVLKTSWKTKNCYAEDVLKTSWRRLEDMPWRRLGDMPWRRLEYMIHVLKTSWRCLGDKQNVYWEYLYLTNLNPYLINLHLTYLYLTNQVESKMH